MSKEITQEDLIIARSKLWTPEKEKLLRKWKKQVTVRERGHLRQARTFSKRHYMIGGPSMILGALVTAGSFGTFRNCNDCDDQSSSKCSIDEVIRIIIGIIGILSTIFAMLHTFMGYQSREEKHKDAMNAHGSFIRRLDDILLTASPFRGDPISVLQDIRHDYDRIERDSPTLPSKYDVELTYEILNPNRMPLPPKPDDISGNKSIRRGISRDSGVSHLKGDTTVSLKKRDTTVDLRKVLEEEDSNSESLAIDIDEALAKENDHDTDDEEVCIGIDLDAAPRYPGLNESVLNMFAMRRDDRAQQSLNRALQFEMQRLNSHSNNSYLVGVAPGKQYYRKPPLKSFKKPKEKKESSEDEDN